MRFQDGSTGCDLRLGVISSLRMSRPYRFPFSTSVTLRGDEGDAGMPRPQDRDVGGQDGVARLGCHSPNASSVCRRQARKPTSKPTIAEDEATLRRTRRLPLRRRVQVAR
jgi:hypothetical protein